MTQDLAQRIASIRERRRLGYQLDVWDTDLLLDTLERTTVELADVRRQVREGAERIADLERRLYARAKYIGGP